MTVLKQCEAKDRLPVAPDHDRSLLRRALTDKSNPLEIASKSPRADKSAFAEDFMAEHSLRGQQITSMAGNF